MFDWAIAELLSDTRASSAGSIWNHPACQMLRQKVTDHGIGSLSTYEQAWLIGVLSQDRSPIISVYGPERSWRFWRASARVADLKKFAIIHHFGYPSYSLGDWHAAVMGARSPDENMRDAVIAISAASASGNPPHGSPIAVTHPAPRPPLLIEGYKRSMAAILDNKTLEIEILFCSP
jgi:hypothetical protein